MVYKLPKTIYVMGKPYKVSLVETIPDSGNAIGRGSHSYLKMELSIKQAPDQMKDTILHEIVHAIDYNTQLKLSERQVHVLSSALIGVVKENPGLFKWVLS